MSTTYLASRLGCVSRLIMTMTLAGLAVPVGAQAAVAVGSTAPMFTIKNHKTGQPLSLAQYRGSVILLDFWAYWCGPCMSAAKDMETNIVKFYQNNGGNRYGVPVTVISISVDPDDPAAVNSFISTYGLELVADDTAGVYNKYGDGYVPYFTVINGTTNSTNFDPWEVLHSDSGYSRTTLKSRIDSVQTPAPVCTLTAPTAGALLRPPIVTLSADVKTNGTIIKRVQFYSGATLIGTRTNLPYTLVWTNSALGARTVFARAYYGTSSKADSASVTFAVANPTPVTAAMNPQGTNLVLCWQGTGLFQVQTTTDLVSKPWDNLGQAMTATNLTLQPTNRAAFYRVLSQ